MMKTFKEFLQSSEPINEAKITFPNKMTFTVITNSDSRGLYIEFIPDYKTLDHPKNVAVEKVMYELNLAMPEFASTLWFDSGNHTTTGLKFRVDTGKLTDVIVKNMK